MTRVFKAAGLVIPAALLLAAAKPPKEPLGLVPIAWPVDNPYSPEKAQLGKLLYFDKRLSADGTVACSTCHDPKFAFTDGAAVSTGIRGQKGGRSAPTVINRAWSLAQFWDGRAGTLEEQALGPMANPIEMGNTHVAIVEKVRNIQGYRPLFQAAFADDAITIDRVAKSITTFERTIMSGNSPYDRWKAGQKNAMPEAAGRGYHIFLQAQCDACHEGANFTTHHEHVCEHRRRNRQTRSGSRTLRGHEEPRRLGRLQDAHTARSRTHRALHARRQHRDARRSRRLLRQRRHAQQEPRSAHKGAASYGAAEGGPRGIPQVAERNGLAKHRRSNIVSGIADKTLR